MHAGIILNNPCSIICCNTASVRTGFRSKFEIGENWWFGGRGNIIGSLQLPQRGKAMNYTSNERSLNALSDDVRILHVAMKTRSLEVKRS